MTATSYFRKIATPAYADSELKSKASNLLKATKAVSQSGTSFDSKQVSVRGYSNSSQYLIMILCPDLGIKVVGYIPENISFQVGSSFSAPFADVSGYSFVPGIGSSMQNIAVASTGSTGMTQAQSIQIWQSTSGIELSLPIQLIAESSVRAEIIEPYLALSELALPYEAPGDLVMKTPGAQFNAMDAVGALTNNISNVVSQNASSAIGWALGANNLGQTKDPQWSSISSDIQSSISSAVQQGFKYTTTVVLGDFLIFPQIVVTNVQMNFESLMVGAQTKPGSQSSPPDIGPGKATLDFSFRTQFNMTIQELIKMFRGDPTKTYRDKATAKSKAGSRPKS